MSLCSVASFALVGGPTAATAAQSMPRCGHVSWKVKYEPGKLEARGITAGKLVVTDVVETTGPPQAVHLGPDRDRTAADGRDVSLVAVSIRDAAGRVAPTAATVVRFSIAGPGRIIGVGNGDPSCHEPDKARRRSAFNGWCLVIVQATERAGDIRLRAQSEGLSPAEAVIRTAAQP